MASRAGVFVQNNLKKSAAAAAAILIIAFLLISPGQAMAVTFEQVCAAFAKMQFIHIRTTRAETGAIHVTTPLEEVWYSREPLVQITLDNDGTYSRFTETDGRFVRYSPAGKLQFSEQYSGEKLQKMVRTLRGNLDFRQNLGLSKFAEVNWSLLEKDVTVDGTLTDVYELVVVNEQMEGYQRKFRVYVDISTDLPVQRELYEYAYLDDKQADSWKLLSTVKYAYPAEIPEDILNPNKFPEGD